MTHTEEEQIHSESTAMIAEAPSYIVLPELKEIFDKPELAS